MRRKGAMHFVVCVAPMTHWRSVLKRSNDVISENSLIDKKLFCFVILIATEFLCAGNLPFAFDPIRDLMVFNQSAEFMCQSNQWLFANRHFLFGIAIVPIDIDFKNIHRCHCCDCHESVLSNEQKKSVCRREITNQIALQSLSIAWHEKIECAMA